MSNRPNNKPPKGKSNKPKQKRKFSTQALARIAASCGRRAKYPEAKILAIRAGVSRVHAYLVVTGKRKSPVLETMLIGIRAELAAAKPTPPLPF